MAELNFELFSSHRFRIGLLIFLAFSGFTVLAIRLWMMQVVDNTKYEVKSQEQSVRTIRIPPVRGRILARDGSAFVENRVSWDVQLHLAELRARTVKDTIANIMKAVNTASERIGRENPLTEEEIQRHMNYYPGMPLSLFTDISPLEMGKLQEEMPRIPGLEIAEEPVRVYPAGPLAAQLLGYVGKNDPKEQDDRGEYFYYVANPGGKSGLEYLYNTQLSGSAGRKLAIVNSSGFVHRYEETEEEKARNGLDLGLTLDIKAQKIAEKLLEDKKGAIVLLNANNGEILAMASAPTYDPGLFVPKISAADYRRLTSDPGKPFLNRAAAGSYMPGSIIKPLTALAVLNAGIDPETVYECSGKAPYGYGPIRCFGGAVHGEIDLQSAIRKSCNGYFVVMGHEAGIDHISSVFQSAGIGEKTGFLLREAAGHLPKNSPSWRSEETAYVSFGQGKVELTPLQAAIYTAAIANGGVRWKPILVSRIYDTSHEGQSVTVFDAKPEEAGRLDASPEALEIVREGMRQVIWEQGGSGKAARSGKIRLCGKTGTADVSRQGVKTKNTWFIGYGEYPAEDENKKTELYAIAIVIEDGESGGRTAAPVAGQFFERWLP